MKYRIPHRWTRETLHEGEYPSMAACVEDANLTGADLTWADLTDANLTGADLTWADLTDANLTGATLTGANLSWADLTDANLTGADLTRANLSGANLTDATLTDANLSGANLTDATLTRANLPSAPIIPDIHRAVYDAASQPEALDMSMWHTCETTHCRAGWVVTLAGDAGLALERQIGPNAAAALIYQASDPGLERVPDWYAIDKDALADMERLAHNRGEQSNGGDTDG